MQEHLILEKCIHELTSISYNMELLGEQTELLKDRLIQHILNQTIGDVYPSFEINEQKMEALDHLLEIFTEEEHQKIYYYAIIKTIAVIFQETGQKLQKQEQYEMLFRYKYLIPVLELLSQNRMMTQHRIAEQLNISSQNLSNFFRRTKDFGFWRKNTVAKNSFYMITAQGKEAYHFYQLKNGTTRNMEQVLTTACSILKAEMEQNIPNAEHVIHALNTKYGKGRSLFHSSELKRQIHHLLNTKWADYDTEIIRSMHYANEPLEYEQDDTASEIYYYVSEMEDYYD